MRSGSDRSRHAWIFGLALAGGLAILAGCGDRGPTNIYSQPLFGVSQNGAQMQVWSASEDSLSPTAADGYVVWLKNTGPGGTMGPVFATLTTTNGCATPVTFGATVATAVFGSKGQVINPGDVFRGQAVDANGNVQNSQYAFEVVSNCASVSINFTVTATDPRGASWTSGFTGFDR